MANTEADQGCQDHQYPEEIKANEIARRVRIFEKDRAIWDQESFSPEKSMELICTLPAKNH